MILFKQANALQEHLRNYQRSGKQTGFVPTMGALHDGHLSLVQAARQSAGITICSIFVNPTQFNDPGDYAKYPVTLEKDIYLLEKAGADILWLPSVEEMYPAGTRQLEHYNLDGLETILEGKYRPGHFQGVCQVMRRLLEKITPDELFMGQKDYQQCMVVQWLLQHLNIKTQLHTCLTVREKDGLAMSSRNMRLHAAAREKAPCIYQSLLMVKDKIRPGDVAPLTAAARAFLTQKGFTVDYITIADRDTLAPVTTWDGQQKLVVLAAAYLGDIRLIDNLLL